MQTGSYTFFIKIMKIGVAFYDKILYNKESV